MTPRFYPSLFIPLSFLGMFLAVVLLRPLLPIDETRYVTVAWEMFLRHDPLAPLTVNGTPYHHKPPLLFWLINAFWALTGEPSRWAATIPPVLAAAASVFLGTKLARALFGDKDGVAARTPLVMMGGFAFLVYGSMVMFDVTLTVFVLATLLALLDFAQKPRFRAVLLMALLLGLGVLTKGPVAYLYVIFPMLLGPVWQAAPVKRSIWYGGCLLAVLLSVLPVLLWLVPVLQQSDDHFAFWLVWEQTAGRITGNFNDAHVRPVVFYLPIVPLLFVPWILFPRFWAGTRGFGAALRQETGLKFLLCWLVPVFIGFSLISGKQPHYLVPLFPGMAILSAWLLRDMKTRAFEITASCAVAVFLLAHVIGAQTSFRNYDLRPVAAFVQQHPDEDWAFVKKYHGEVTFLARHKAPLDVVPEPGDLAAWFAAHPGGYAIMRYKRPEEVAAYSQLLTIPYRGKSLGIFQQKAETPAPE